MTGELPFFVFLATLKKEERGRLPSSLGTNSESGNDSDEDYCDTYHHKERFYDDEGFVHFEGVDHVDIQILRLLDLDGRTVGEEIKSSENCLTGVHDNFFDGEPYEYDYEDNCGTNLYGAKVGQPRTRPA